MPENRGALLDEGHTSDHGRRIIHVDMDAFYAAIEQRDDPDLRGRPIAVGSESRRGVVLTASYEARTFGIRSAMPSLTARRLCPELQFVVPRFEAYKQASRNLHRILASHASGIEPLSLDEAYLDVTENCSMAMRATDIAKRIKAELRREELSLTASAGVSYNKFLAKTASDMRKPDGLTVIRPDEAFRLLAGLPIEKFHGIGPATARRLHEAGIRHGADIQKRTQGELRAMLGKSGELYWRLAHGIDHRPVDANRVRTSISVETTFVEDISGLDHLNEELLKLSGDLDLRCRRSAFTGRTLTVKIKYADFRIGTRSHTASHPIAGQVEIARIGTILLTRAPLDHPVRLLGIGLSRNQPTSVPGQLDLPFADQG